MKIIGINAVSYGSTGRIMFSIADKAIECGHSVICTSGYTRVDCNRNNWWLTSGYLSKGIHKTLAIATGGVGCFSVLATYNLIRHIRNFQPDLIHLHNIHGWYLNFPIFFSYIKKHQIPIVWTLHDCWAFTGHCPHFVVEKCEKWKTACYNCPNYRGYPQSFVDNSKYMHKLKKKWFSGISKLTLVTPSKWLAGLVKESFLKDYPVKVINNGIDLSVFKPCESSFREKFGIEQNKRIVLGVAFGWGYKKGLDVFLKLSEKLGKDYQVVLVGTDDSIDQKLPENIISIHRTNNQTELAEIYSAADVFANPTREETLGLVNIEALACGTPVVTFDTGGSPECIDETCGIIVPCDDVDAMERAIRYVCGNTPFTKKACIMHAIMFDKDKKYEEYLELFCESIDR